MKKSSRDLRETWKLFFEQPDTTVQAARDKISQYQHYCRRQQPHQQLVPGYDMLTWMGIPMSQSMHKIRLFEYQSMKDLIPKLDLKNLKILYHRLKPNWTSKIFRSLCIDILRRIALHKDHVKLDLKIMHHHATLFDDVRDIPMKFLHQLWANDEKLTDNGETKVGVTEAEIEGHSTNARRSEGSTVRAKVAGWQTYQTGQITRSNANGTYDIKFEDPHRGKVFERKFRPLIRRYINDSQKGIQYTNILTLVQLSKKNRYISPNEVRGANKNLTKSMLFHLNGDNSDHGDRRSHTTLVKKLLHLIRKMYCETNNPALGALRCDIIIALKEDHKKHLVEQGVDRCHELIHVVDNVRKLQYISVDTLKSLKRKVGQILRDKCCFNLSPNQEGIPAQLIFKALEGPDITVAQQQRRQRAQHLGSEGYPSNYAKINKFDPTSHTYTASENQVVKKIATRFKIHPKHIIRCNRWFNMAFVKDGLKQNDTLKKGTILRIPTPDEIEDYDEVDAAIAEVDKIQVREYMREQRVSEEGIGSGSSISGGGLKKENILRNDERPVDKNVIMELIDNLIQYDKEHYGDWSQDNGGLFTPLVDRKFVDDTGRAYETIIPNFRVSLQAMSNLSKAVGRPFRYKNIQIFRSDLNTMFDNCRKFWTPNPHQYGGNILLPCFNFRTAAAKMIDDAMLRVGYYTEQQAKYGGKTDAEKDKQHSEMKRFMTRFVSELQKEDWYQHFKVALKPNAQSEHPDSKGQTYNNVCPIPLWWDQIKRNIKDDIIFDPNDLMSALDTMFNNCINFLNPNSPRQPDLSAILEAKRFKIRSRTLFNDLLRQTYTDDGSKFDTRYHKVRNAMSHFLREFTKLDKPPAGPYFAAPINFDSMGHYFPMFHEFAASVKLNGLLDISTIRSRFYDFKYLKINSRNMNHMNLLNITGKFFL